MITHFIQVITMFITNLVGGNQFATGLLLTSFFAGISYLIKDVPAKILKFITKELTTTLILNSQTTIYFDLMKYFQKQNVIKKVRKIKLSNGMYGDNELTKDIGYGRHLIFYHHHLLFINSYKEDSTSRSVKEFIEITKFGRSQNLFNLLINDCSKDEYNNNKTKYSKYVDGYLKKNIIISNKMYLSDIILSKNNQKILKNKLQRFLKSENWFLKNHIPWTLGILLYGPPGSGKTTLIKAIAGEINYNIIIISTMEDLIESNNKTYKKTIFIIEEFDTFGLENRDIKTKNISTIQKYTIGDILNSIDGLIINHGRIIIFTTNHIQKLDKALLRPGRIDLKLKLDYVNKYMFLEIIKKFYSEEEYNRFKNKEFEIIKKVTIAFIQEDIIRKFTIDQLFKKYTNIKKLKRG